MSNAESIKQQILEIEDFKNVDAELMREIESNDEYRMLFQQCRSLSETIGSMAPSPEKDGITLHDALMKRVKEGDIAPRYIKTNSFRFPFATVACLCVVVAVVLVSKSGFLQSKMSDSAAPEEMNLQSDREMVYDGVTYFAGVAENGNSNEDAKYTVVDESAMQDSALSDYEAEEEYVVADDAAEGQTEPAYEGAAASKEKVVGQPEMESESLSDSVTAEESAEMKKAVERAKAESASGGDSGIAQYHVSQEVQIRLREAELMTGKADIITAYDIIDLGEENFVSFFDSISKKDNFSELYTLKNFKIYCENN